MNTDKAILWFIDYFQLKWESNVRPSSSFFLHPFRSIQAGVFYSHIWLL